MPESALPSASQSTPIAQPNAGSPGFAAWPAPPNSIADYWARIAADRLRDAPWAPPVFSDASGQFPPSSFATAPLNLAPIPPRGPFADSPKIPDWQQGSTSGGLLANMVVNLAAPLSNLPSGMLFGGAQPTLANTDTPFPNLPQNVLFGGTSLPPTLTRAIASSSYDALPDRTLGPDADANRDESRARSELASSAGAQENNLPGGEAPGRSYSDYLRVFLNAFNPIGSANAQEPPPVGFFANLQRMFSEGWITSIGDIEEIRRTAEAMRRLDNARLQAAIDGYVYRQAWALRNSAEFDQLREAYRAGQPLEVRYNGRIIRYEPGMPPRDPGISGFNENGFTIGPSTFASREEEWKTVLHELYRLTMTEAGASGEFSGEAAKFETEQAQAFVARMLGSADFRRAAGLPELKR